MFSICHFVSYTVLICFLIFVSATIQDQKAFGSAQSFGEFCLRLIIDSVLLWCFLCFLPGFGHGLYM